MTDDSPPDPPETILILEDDEGVARLQQLRLVRAGFRTVWVESPALALGRLSEGGIDLLLLDNYLSDGETGIEFYTRLKQRGLTIPVILVTGHGDDRTVIEALRIGVADFILKSSEYLDYLPEATRRVLDQERIRKRFADSQARLYAVIYSALDGIISIGEDGRITMFNPAAERIFRCPAPEAIGRPATDFFPNGIPHEGTARTDLWMAQSDFRPMEVDGIRADGTSVPLEMTHSRVEITGQVIQSVILRDVTERQQAEAAVRESQAFTRSVIDSLGAHVAVLDKDGTILAVNSAWERFAREHKADLTRCGVGVNYLEVCRRAEGPYSEEAPHVERGIVSVLEGKAEQYALEYPCSWAGNDRWFTLDVTPLTGGRKGVVVAHVDITERKRIEKALLKTSLSHERALLELQAKTEELRSTTQQLWQAARLAGVGELAASIAHELNNPLGTVSLRIEGDSTKTPPDDPRRRGLEIVQQETDRMARLVANLLQFSRPGRDQVSTVNVCNEILQAIELTDHHMRRRGVQVQPDFEPGLPDIYADRQQLRQVFLNLFTNAADAMPSGGRLIPRVQRSELPGQRPAIQVEIVDTGTGITPEFLPRVTDPFFSTKEEGKGTGLGLAICRRIIQEHEGTLNIESKVGEGTIVRITLPTRTEKNVSGLRNE